MGSSLDEFLASFKRAVPGFKSFENSMTEPDVLKFISLWNLLLNFDRIDSALYILFNKGHR